MISRTLVRTSFAVLLLLLAACGGGGGSGSDSGGVTEDPSSWIRRWNQVAIDASGIDHAGSGEQLGPTKASRAMAIAHIAMYDALNVVEPVHRTYLQHASPPAGASKKSAIAASAHRALVALYPSQRGQLDAFLGEDLATLEAGQATDDGISVGVAVADAILAARNGDGSELSTVEAENSYEFSGLPGHWRKDPLNPQQTPIGTLWSRVAPFSLDSAAQYRAPPPPALDSNEYAEAYADVFRLGGDGVITPTERSEEQTQIGIFWAYDGTPSLCAPPRLYNQVARRIAEVQGTEDVHELARLFALVNTALADAAISIWEAKYFYDLWRPVTAIREADEGLGPSGLGDGNPLTLADPNFTPLGAPASNLSGTDFTPPFPTYPSGHAGFGGALFEVLRRYYGTDDIAFSFVSDEFNGETVDSQGNTRPRVERSYSKLSEAEFENGQSRIYLGIHFSFDMTSAIDQGRRVGAHVFEREFGPLTN